MLDFQPFPLQSSSLFGASSGVASSPVAMGTVGVGNVARNVNIHIHTGRSHLRMHVFFSSLLHSYDFHRLNGTYVKTRGFSCTSYFHSG